MPKEHTMLVYMHMCILIMITTAALADPTIPSCHYRSFSCGENIEDLLSLLATLKCITQYS